MQDTGKDDTMGSHPGGRSGAKHEFPHFDEPEADLTAIVAGESTATRTVALSFVNCVFAGTG